MLNLTPLHPTPGPHPRLRQTLTRSALTQLRSEAKQMEVRIGIVNHTLVAKKLKSDSATRAEASVPKNKHIDHETYMDDDLEDY